MVVFRHLGPDVLAEHETAVIQRIESKVWKICMLLGIDPRTFALDYVIPPPVEGRLQDGENGLFDLQQKVKDAYARAGITSYSFGDHMDVAAKLYITNHTMEILERLVIQRCSELGVHFEDLHEGWTNGHPDFVELEEYIDRLYKAYAIADSLPS